MAGKISVNQVQLGDSSTATNNFVWQTNVDGTCKLARGNVGATTQDILTVDAAGKVKQVQQPKITSTNGYVELPGGLLLQWGETTTSPVTFPTPFPNACLQVIPQAQHASDSAIASRYNQVTNMTASTFTLGSIAGLTNATRWFAIGY